MMIHYIAVYGGHPGMTRHIQDFLPDNYRLRFFPSTKHALDTGSLGLYDAAFIITTNISHSSCWAFRKAAQNRGIPCIVLHVKGAESVAQQIMLTFIDDEVA